MIKVNYKCIGCGSCELTAPTNFMISNSVAVVIGNKINNSTRQAVKNCPVKAIEI